MNEYNPFLQNSVDHAKRQLEAISKEDTSHIPKELLERKTAQMIKFVKENDARPERKINS